MTNELATIQCQGNVFLRSIGEWVLPCKIDLRAMTSIPLCALQLDIGHIPTRPLMEYRVYRLMVKRSLQNSNGAYALHERVR